MKNIRIALLILFFSSILFSCTKQNEQTYIINELRKSNQIDLGILVNQEYDYLVILDEGSSLKQYDIYVNNDDNWLGQRIIFFKDNKILKQIDLDYYVSKPKKKYYLSFFETVNPNTYFIKREKGNSVFTLTSVTKIGNDSYCYFLE